MSRRVSVRRRDLRDLLSIASHEDFHDYLLNEALSRYAAHRRRQGLSLGRALAVCANRRDARILRRFAFDEITLSAITNPSAEINQHLADDARCTYTQQNSECLTFPSRSFDLVMCKEGIHHLARPVLGFYEMLRVARGAILLIEPAETHIGLVLERLGLSTVFEVNQSGNVRSRDNYVFRWSVRQFDHLLKSYYLDSGYQIDVTVGWMSSRFNANVNPLIRKASAVSGWLAGFLPGSRGNYMTALILPGTDLPKDPKPAILVEARVASDAE